MRTTTLKLVGRYVPPPQPASPLSVEPPDVAPVGWLRVRDGRDARAMVGRLLLRRWLVRTTVTSGQRGRAGMMWYGPIRSGGTKSGLAYTTTNLDRDQDQGCLDSYGGSQRFLRHARAPAPNLSIPGMMSNDSCPRAATIVAGRRRAANPAAGGCAHGVAHKFLGDRCL